MKKVIYILCGVALAGLLLVGCCAGLFFYMKNQEENVMTELLNEKPTLQKYLGVFEKVMWIWGPRTNDLQTGN